MAGPGAPASVGEVFLVALRLGLTSFGGPTAHLGLFRREYVERRRWLDDHAFGDLLALSQSLPGPSSSQLGMAIGTRRAGIMGGLAAWLGFTLPSAVLMIGFAAYATTADVADAGWVHGLKLAAVAVVAAALLSMARALTPDLPRLLVAALACGVALVWVTPVSQVAIIAAGALIGWLLLASPGARPSDPEPGRVPRWLGLACLGLFVVLLLGLPILRSVDGSALLAQLDAFYRAGALVFGGGHVVLPLLDATIVGPGWVSESAFLAGYGAAQAMPGPLFSFAGYLGSVSTVPPGGWLGGTVALLAIYLPSFLLVFGALPTWDRLRASDAFRRALTGTNAAVVGLLAAALWTPVWTSAVSAPVDVAVVALGFGLLLTGRVSPIAVVALSAVLGELV